MKNQASSEFSLITIILISGSLCSKLIYDNFSRGQTSAAAEVIKNFKIPEPGSSSKKKRKRKRKSRRRKRTTVRRMKPRKNSIFNRPPTRGCSRDHGRYALKEIAMTMYNIISINNMVNLDEEVMQKRKR